MLNQLLPVLAALMIVVPAQGAPVVRGPEAVVRDLLDGWEAGDASKAAAMLAPDFRLLTLRRSAGGVEVQAQDRASLIEAMRTLKPHVWDVRIGKVRVEQDTSGIATVWAPYTFYLNGKKSHCGVETYQLYRLAEGWKIVSFADTHLWDGADAKCPDRSR